MKKKWRRKVCCLFVAVSLLSAKPGTAYAMEAVGTADKEGQGAGNGNDTVTEAEGMVTDDINRTDESMGSGAPDAVQAGTMESMETVEKEAYEQEQQAEAEPLTESDAYKPYEDATYALTYTYKFGRLSVSGYRGIAEGKLVIPDEVEGIPVTGIGDYAFSEGSGFTGELIIPDSVTSIGRNAFKGCWGLTGELAIPDGVTYIGESAFYWCDGFTGDLTIPGSVTYIGDSAFYSCEGLTGSLTIPGSVTHIGNSAFYSCKGLTGSLAISDGVRSIGAFAFAECKELTGFLMLPDSVTGIGEYAFRNCSGFTGNLVIPDSVTGIGRNAFEGCSSFTGNLVIPDSVTSIGGCAFSGCSGLTGNLVIPDSVTEIEGYAFSGCSGFTGNLVIPDSVTSIEGHAFEGCSGLTGRLVIPDSVTGIEDLAFAGCSGFTGNLTIPDGVTYIGRGAFAGCSGFTGDLTIPDGVASIADDAFVGCTGLSRNIYLADKITDIGRWALLSPLDGEMSDYNHWISSNMSDELRKSVVIHAPKGSCAEAWARDNRCTFVPYRTLVSNENISVGFEEGDIPAAGVLLAARHLATSDPEYKEIDLSDKLADTTVDPQTISFEAYDITLVDGNRQPVQPPNQMKVSIPCPAGYEGDACRVYRVNGDGSLKDMSVTQSGNNLIFFTNRCCTYIITEAELKSASEVVYGDANGDGSVNSLDAVLIKRYLAGYESLGMDETAADVNGDGRVNSLDAVKILQRLAGYDVVLGQR